MSTNQPNIMQSGVSLTQIDTKTARVGQITTFTPDQITQFAKEEAVRQILEAIRNSINIIDLRQYIIQKANEIVPKRSGKLIDSIIESLNIIINSQCIQVFMSYPATYPRIIPNPQHLGEVGYGEKYTPIHATGVSVAKETEKGTLYNLNDPNAHANYMDKLESVIEVALINYFEEIITSLMIVVSFGKPSGRVLYNLQEDFKVGYRPQSQVLAIGNESNAQIGQTVYVNYNDQLIDVPKAPTGSFELSNGDSGTFSVADVSGSMSISPSTISQPYVLPVQYTLIQKSIVIEINGDNYVLSIKNME